MLECPNCSDIYFGFCPPCILMLALVCLRLCHVTGFNSALLNALLKYPLEKLLWFADVHHVKGIQGSFRLQDIEVSISSTPMQG